MYINLNFKQWAFVIIVSCRQHLYTKFSEGQFILFFTHDKSFNIYF